VSGEPFGIRLKQLCQVNHSELDTCSYEHFFLTMTHTMTSKNIDPSSRITLYLCVKLRRKDYAINSMLPMVTKMTGATMIMMITGDFIM